MFTAIQAHELYAGTDNEALVISRRKTRKNLVPFCSKLVPVNKWGVETNLCFLISIVVRDETSVARGRSRDGTSLSSLPPQLL